MAEIGLGGEKETVVRPRRTVIGSLLQKEEGERERERKKNITPNHDLLRTRLFSDTASRRTPDTLAARVSALATAAARIRVRVIEPMCILQ